MGLDIFLLALGLGLILLASVLFTNAIEVLGQRLGMHQGAVGSILAAVGTALPETIIPIIAILWVGDAAAKQVAVGAIAGAPFMLATLAFFVTGAAVVAHGAIKRRSHVMKGDVRVLSRDLSFFLVLYTAAVLATFLHDWFLPRAIIAVGLVAAYVFYIHVTLKSEAAEMEDVDRLYFSRVLPNNMPVTCSQLFVSLAVMIWGGHMFVVHVEGLSAAAGLSPLVLSLILTPIATELPEKFNSVIWVGRGKDTLALGNITGAMVFQCSFPVAFGLVGTPWDLMENHGVTMVSAVLALGSALIVFLWVRLRQSLHPAVLMAGGLLYVFFIVYVLRFIH